MFGVRPESSLSARFFRFTQSRKGREVATKAAGG
jgi:hypothetical protein